MAIVTVEVGRDEKVWWAEITDNSHNAFISNKSMDELFVKIAIYLVSHYCKDFKKALEAIAIYLVSHYCKDFKKALEACEKAEVYQPRD